MLSDRAYYDRLKRRYLAAEASYRKNRTENKRGADTLLEETPSSPSELRQYIEVAGVFAADMDGAVLRSVCREASNLLGYWETERPGNLDLVQAREKMAVIERQIRKNKRANVVPYMLALVIVGGFVAALIIFPGFASLMKTVFWLDYIQTRIINGFDYIITLLFMLW